MDKIHYKIVTRVKKVEKLDRVVRTTVDSETKEVLQEKEELGWFVTFEGSWEKLYFGEEKPALESGMAVEIIVRRMD